MRVQPRAGQSAEESDVVDVATLATAYIRSIRTRGVEVEVRRQVAAGVTKAPDQGTPMLSAGYPPPLTIVRCGLLPPNAAPVLLSTLSALSVEESVDHRVDCFGVRQLVGAEPTDER
jgi:hypothetical protein